jgi:hypothetical protein
MPKPLIWSLPQDLQLRRMRTEGASWDEIAAELRVSRWSVIERGLKIRLRKHVASASPPAMRDPGREPLPAGHHASWGALTAETTLHGQTYPWPPLSYGG